MPNNIRHAITGETVKKIFGNKDNAIIFLRRLGISVPKTLRSSDVYNFVVAHWDFEKGVKIVRDLFTETEKYRRGKVADKTMQLLLEDWNTMRLGKVRWPFSQGDFDGFVQRVNVEQSVDLMKDEKVKKASVKYRRIKEINTLRNDFIETLIFEKNPNILPTLSHRRGVDFFINGEQYDQKVGSSPTRQFIEDFGKGEEGVGDRVSLRNTVVKDVGMPLWKKTAINNPDLVAQYLYTFQDEGRFGADQRLLVVYIDEHVTVKRMREILDEVDLTNPLEVEFEYKHKNHGVRRYKTKCFVILLHNAGV